ncbi:MAG TPA: ABC transporter permease [Clostridia bacterium]|nr:ABC transporter permease [Clostridia bacterium]
MLVSWLKRIGTYILVLLGLSILVFVIGRVIPGDPARQALGPRAPEDVVQALRVEMNLDKPYLIQYGLWLKGATRLDLGKSLMTRRPVIEDVKEFLPATLEIVFISAFLMAVGGILLGILSAKYSDTWLDGIIRVISYLGIVSPAFVWAIIFMLIFGYNLPIFPTTGRIGLTIISPPTVTGMHTIDFLLNGDIVGFKDALAHLILPAVALMLGGLAQAARITRSSMTENSTKDYILAEQAYGIPERKILFKYLLKPSLIPTVSVLSLDMASLFGSAFLVEQLFNYPGLSKYGMQAMLNKDLNAISAVIMILGIIFIIVNILIDIVVAYLDPRVRLMGGGNQ